MHFYLKVYNKRSKTISMSGKIAIAIHGGAGEDSSFYSENKKGYSEGLEQAIEAGYSILEEHGTSLDAVQAAVEALENNPLFNAGRGSALNNKGEVTMDSSIMDGNSLKAGAVSMIRRVKN